MDKNLPNDQAFHDDDEHQPLCPLCGSVRILEFEEETFCLDCDWDDIDLFARLSIFSNPRAIHMKMLEDLREAPLKLERKEKDF